MAKLMVGYSDRLSVAAGEQQSFMVSANIAGPYNASLVAVIGGGTRVDGIGFREREIEWLHSGVHIGEPRTCHPGSYGLVDNVPAVDGTGTIGVFFKPTLLGKAEQTILDVGTGALVVTVNDVGLNVGTANEPSACLPVVLNAWHWVLIRIGCNTLNVLLRRFGTSPNEPRTEHELRRPWRERVGAGRLSIGASVVESQHGLRPRAAFNGRIELPWLAGTVLDDEQAERLASGKASFEGLIAAWDFSIAISSDRIVDASGNNLDGRLFNTPTRGVRGIRWDGSEHDWRKQPSQYGAIHFHSEALTDAAWPPDICWTVPEHLASGVYAVKLTQGDAEGYIPFFVRASQQRAKIVFIAATATYLAYANSWFSTSASVIAKRPLSPGDEYLQQHPEVGLSLYEQYADGSGVHYSSHLRPIIDFRPKHGSGCFTADTDILAWLDHLGFDFDVLTDEDLHRDGSLLREYTVAITGCHPEYASAAMLDALNGHLDAGGRLIYLGGNGFYQRVAFNPTNSSIIELRRAEHRGRAWDSEPGEYYHNFTGEYGGLWRFSGRAPNGLVGVGFTAVALEDGAAGYERQIGSDDCRAAFIFEGTSEGPRFGAYGTAGGGSVSQEIDRWSPYLGSPRHALIVASSYNLPPHFVGVQEDLTSRYPNLRADMVFFETPSGGAVFSVGSMGFAAALAHNSYDNDIYRITNNVLNRFLDPTPFQFPLVSSYAS